MKYVCGIGSSGMQCFSSCQCKLWNIALCLCYHMHKMLRNTHNLLWKAFNNANTLEYTILTRKRLQNHKFQLQEHHENRWLHTPEKQCLIMRALSEDRCDKLMDLSFLLKHPFYHSCLPALKERLSSGHWKNLCSLALEPT